MSVAKSKNRTLQTRLERAGISVSLDTAGTLRRIERTLHRWAELECGDSANGLMFCIERDETTNKPYLFVSPEVGNTYRRPIPDRERGALRRLAAICQEIGAHYYHQTDPRGIAVYLSREPLTDQTYSHATPVTGGAI